jgi:ubiquinone/menaquinone biosynthesis C-methylase UbiE
MLMNNIQTFSAGSDQYAKHRPQYPPELFLFLDQIASGHDRAWDCATGNGQAAVSCAKYFSHVEATDISAQQIQHGIVHPQVHYSVSPAERTSFDNHSFDLIIVAQAVHWFDRDKFFQETERVLKPNGILAVWGYGFFNIEPKVDDIIANVLLEPIDRFWAEGNRQLMAGYRDLTLPFEEVRNVPTFTMQIEWRLEQLLAYLRTWSAVKRYSAELGNDPVIQLEEKLKLIWHEPEKAKLVQMPLFLKASRKTA